jgi:tRNA-binding EMAP/Myf-like protein
MKDDTNSEIITKLMMNKAGILETANITRIAKTRMRVAKIKTCEEVQEQIKQLQTLIVDEQLDESE